MESHKLYFTLFCNIVRLTTTVIAAFFSISHINGVSFNVANIGNMSGNYDLFNRFVGSITWSVTSFVCYSDCILALRLRYTNMPLLLKLCCCIDRVVRTSYVYLFVQLVFQ